MAFSQETDCHERTPIRRTKTSLPAAIKKQGSGSLIGKLFGRQSESRSVEIESLEEGTEDFPDAETFLGIIQPCPFIKPLEHRLEPRIEPIRSRRPLSNVSSDMVVSPITRARKRGETNAILTGCISDEDLATAVEEDDSSGTTHEQFESCLDNLSVSDLQQIEYVAVMASHHPDGVKHWRYYIECYTKGQFSLINPPSPPQCSCNFKYLPAVYPPNETQRISLFSRYDILWPQWAQQKVGHIMRKAMNDFGTRFASLSFFDDKFELFKVENGYSRSQIDRDISIGAHVLFSSDVMVVLDTKKDWRFENNPLVVHRPRIRFFAGAPLLSAEGEVMGVLAVFEKEPRTAFSAQQRGELAEFSRQIMTDMNHQTDCLSDPELRMTPILQRNSVINGDYLPRNIKSTVMGFNTNDVESDLLPSGLHYYKVANSSKQNSRLYINRHTQNNLGHHAEPTPPSSAESNHNSFFDKSESYGKNHEQLSEDPVLNDISSLGRQTMLNSQHLRISTPRPFSGSDITSLNPHPPNTPDRSVKDGVLSHQPKFDLTVDDFLSLSDTDCVEQSRDEQLEGDEVVEKSSINQHEVTQQQRSLENTLYDNFAAEDCPRTSRDITNVPSTPFKGSFAQNSFPSTASSPLIDLSSPPREPDNSMALVPYAPSPLDHLSGRMSASSFNSSQSSHQKAHSTDAAYACKLIAQQLGYDLIYCVELRPPLPFMTDQELYAESGLRKTLLAAYGLSQPIELSSETHIGVLRSRGYHWDNPQDHYDEGEYETGCMVPIHSEGGPLLLRSSGIVMGAFRKPRPNGKREIRDTKDDLKRLMDFGKTLRCIFLKDKPQLTTKRSNTEPAAPTSYPANEAMEVTFGDKHAREYSLHARHVSAFPANEAVEVTFGNSLTRKYSSNPRHGRR